TTDSSRQNTETWIDWSMPSDAFDTHERTGNILWYHSLFIEALRSCNDGSSN
ncbi:Hypothetical protein FKW44_009500, partial [Caligus rogercresseyi]